MTINLQTSPYYDDFNEEKDFYRILFKPGYAVQARELTQLQTLLQEQIKRFGNHVFKDGSVVVGCAETFQFTVPYVKITREDQLGAIITDSLYQTYESSLVDSIVTNEIGVTARIVLLTKDPNGQRVLYLNYLTASTDGTNQTTFSPADILTITNVNGTTLTRRFVAENTSSAVGTGALFRIDDGIVYAQGHFVRHTSQTKVLEYFSSSPTKNVGYRILEEGVTSDDDVTLLDPAAGSYNYAAPGADRYRLTTQLESYELATTPESGFYLLFVVDEGQVKRAFNKPQYAEFQKTLAQRTFDESGNYVVSGLNVAIREHLKTATNNGKFALADGGSAAKLVYGVEPGKAYVEGYEAELKSTEYLTVDKATDTATFDEKLISTAFGNYVLVTAVTGDWDLTDSCLAVKLKTGSTTVATAHVTLLKHHSGAAASGTFRLYLQNITIQSPYTSDNLATVTTITDDAGNSCTVSGGFATQEPSLNTLLFPTTVKGVVAFEPAATTYFYWKKWSGSINPSITISLSTNEEWLQLGTLSASDIKSNFLVVNTATNALVDLTASGSSVVVSNNSATVTLNSGSSATHTIYGLVRIKNQNPISVSLERAWLKVDGTALTGASATNLTNKRIYLGVSNGYDIEAVYAYPSFTGPTENPFPSVEDFTGWTNITADCTMVNNQNDNFYETSYIQYSGGLNLATQKLVIKYRYFLRTSNSGFLNKNSYAGVLIDADPANPTTPPVNMEYKWLYTYQLPLYRAQATGVTYDLRDVIDFRPSKAIRAGYNANSYLSSIELVNGHNVPSDFQTGIYIPDPDRELTATFTYNLPRIDKVILTRDGQFQVLRGISSLQPQSPADAAHAMTLGEIHLAPYPSLSTHVAKQEAREDYASFVRLIDNRRYTMKDIGDLEQRVNRLEYYTALSIMENQVANTVIYEDPTDTTSDILAKKGILVDNFDGHDVANVYSAEYASAIDTRKKELRPAFDMHFMEFERASGGTKVGQMVLTGSSVGNSVLLRNDAASKSRVCGNAILGNYRNGILELDPPQDIWFDEAARPDVQVNYQGTNDGWEFSSTPFTIHWNGWQTIWQGVDIIAPVAVDNMPSSRVVGVRSYNESAQLVNTLTRSMVFSQQMPNNNLRSLALKVFDISIIPFIRQQVVTFVARGMMPNAVVKPFFDNEEVAAHCRPITLPSGVTLAALTQLSAPELVSLYETNAGQYGDDLVVDAQGQLIGQFLIPANTFRSGSRVFKLENDAKSLLAAAQFVSSGLAAITDTSIASTRFADVRQDALSSVQNTVINRLTFSNPSTFDATSYGDPMAQTFIVENEVDGVMVTAVDLFFRKKSATHSITVQLREVINGYPGNKIVPFSTVTLAPAQVQVSELSSVPTTFTFSSPVYLKNNVEYAIVILPENNNTDYEVWVSELGQNQLLTGDRITQQPYVGVLFIPNNNTAWTALESEDLKFTLHKAQFSTVDTTVTLKSAPIDFVTFTASGEHALVPGDVATVYAPLIGTETARTGTISVNLRRVTGSSTDFLTEVKVGDRLRAEQTGFTAATFGTTSVTGTGFSTRLRKGDLLFDGTTLLGKIATVNSDTALELESNAPTSGSVIDPKARVIVGMVADVTAAELKLEEPYSNTLPLNVEYFVDAITARGVVKYVHDDHATIYVTQGKFSANDSFVVRPAISGKTADTTFTLTSIDNIVVTALAPNFGALSVAPTATVDFRYRLMNASGELATSFTAIKNGETLELQAPATVFSYSNLINGNTRTAEFSVVLSTTNSGLSPALDVRKLGALVLTNKIDDTASDAQSVYITRAVTLDDPADNIRVYLDVKKPEGTEINVYAKLQRAGDNTPFDSMPWGTEMVEYVKLPLNRETFQEYTYFINPAQLAGLQFSKFALKIEMFSSNQSKVPKIKNFRAVALI